MCPRIDRTDGADSDTHGAGRPAAGAATFTARAWDAASAGVHLHWAPDALLRGSLGNHGDTNEGCNYRLPDRWIVLRLVMRRRGASRRDRDHHRADTAKAIPLANYRLVPPWRRRQSHGGGRRSHRVRRRIAQLGRRVRRRVQPSRVLRLAGDLATIARGCRRRSNQLPRLRLVVNPRSIARSRNDVDRARRRDSTNSVGVTDDVEVAINAHDANRRARKQQSLASRRPRDTPAPTRRRAPRARHSRRSRRRSRRPIDRLRRVRLPTKSSESSRPNRPCRGRRFCTAASSVCQSAVRRAWTIGPGRRRSASRSASRAMTWRQRWHRAVWIPAISTHDARRSGCSRRSPGICSIASDRRMAWSTSKTRARGDVHRARRGPRHRSASERSSAGGFAAGRQGEARLCHQHGDGAGQRRARHRIATSKRR